MDQVMPVLRYHPVVQMMHWVTFWLMLFVYGVSYLEEFFPKGSDERHFIWFAHISVGLLLLAIVIARVIMKNTHKAWHIQHSAEEKKVTLVHTLLYQLMIVTMLIGIYLAFVRGNDVSFFGLFSIPSPIEPNPELKGIVKEAHELFANILILFILLHAAAAVFHHLVLKDGVLHRMLPDRK